MGLSLGSLSCAKGRYLDVLAAMSKILNELYSFSISLTCRATKLATYVSEILLPKATPSCITGTLPPSELPFFPIERSTASLEVFLINESHDASAFTAYKPGR